MNVVPFQRAARPAPEPAAPDDPARARERANREQRDASDPRASAFVAANAGSGKTRVLTDRLLRLMLDGEKGVNPARIQCLTFTKAAAAEMAVRLQGRLGAWVTLPDEALDRELQQLNVPATAEKRRLARALFARVLDLPGGMRIGTIHAFCQSLLRRFPLEAAISPQFRMLEDAEAREMLDRAREDVLATEPGAVGALPGVVSAAGFAGLVHDLQGAALRSAWIRGQPPGRQAVLLARALGLPAVTEAEVLADAVSWPGEEGLRDALRLVLERGSDAAQKRAAPLLDWLSRDPARRAAEWDDVWVPGYMTASLAPRALSAFAGKALAAKHPEIEVAVTAEQTRIPGIEDRRRAAREVELTTGLLGLAGRVLDAYAAAKRRAGALDFQDLVARSDALLRDPGAAWVLYKLDGGMDHLLLDEVQDTAPEQWQIAHTLTEEFFAGLGATDAERTFFAVGDLKQSIYSFQGADPAEFERSRDQMRGRVKRAGRLWRDVALDVSFRSTPAVLRLVDAVFADGPAREGVAGRGEVVRHYTDRVGQAGRVELWPLAPLPEASEAEPWSIRDRNETAVGAPQRLADGIATWLARQIRDGVRLESKGRPLRAGDVLVLVRKRNAFARALVRALKAQGVAVAGLDRLALLDQAAVQDILALCDAVLLPEDDLQLACVLTSPLGGLDDDSLMDLAMGRQGTLWDVLRARAGERDVWDRAWRFLSQLRARADYVTPYALLGEALGPLGGRARLFRRLGAEAAEPVDELLGAALRYGTSHPPSLQGFVHWLRRQAAEVKRESEPAGGAVRVMTVHGAKGLEAPVVILPDTTTGFGKEESLAWLPGGKGEDGASRDVPVWSPVKPRRSKHVRDAYDRAGSLQQAELNRLLYVALTRAEDRLVICGWETRRPQPGSWYELVQAGFERLGARKEPFDLVRGAWEGERLVYDTPQAGPPQAHEPRPEGTPVPLPAWAGRAPDWQPAPLPPEPPVPQPLAPSRPEGIELGGVPAARSPLAEPDASRFLRGTVAHQLLQHLPEVPDARREEAAHAFAEQPGLGLGPEAGARVAEAVLAVLRHPDLRPLFGPGSRAEQPLTGRVGDAVVRGVVDRLAVLPDAVLVADYKTNRDPPREAAGTPVAYLRQMAAYRAVLRGIYGDRDVRCTLVWTEGCRVMPLPDALLDEHAPGS